MKLKIRSSVLLPMAFFALGLYVYGDGFSHEFQLDSTYGLVKNPAIRSLSNIPQFFTDPFTLTSLRQNADYRPVLQMSYALNYAVSGLDMWSWHLMNIGLHVVNSLLLVAFARRWLPHLLGSKETNMVGLIPWIIGLVFLVHPTASGVVNYQWARSSLLTATFALPAILCWMSGRSGWTLFFYTLALFTKVEAIGVLGVLVLWTIFERGLASRRDTPMKPPSLVVDLLACCRWVTLRPFVPLLVVTTAYGWIRMALLPEFLTESRSDQGVGMADYALTQLTVWWHYIGNWWAPVGLVADHASYPVYRHVFEGPVLVSMMGWIAVGLALRLLYTRRPAYLVVALSALALISPTSSWLPLAEMVNEHRPYLPLACLSVLWLVPLLALILTAAKDSFGARLGIIGLALCLSTVSIAATKARNDVFRTWVTYWSDVVTKAPSWRAHLNLGWFYLKEKKYGEAEAALNAARRLAPQNVFIWTNLGLLYEATSRQVKARKAYGEAVGSDRYNSIGLEARGRFFLRIKAYDEAQRDLRAAAARTMAPFDLYRDLGTAEAGRGHVEAAIEALFRCRALDDTRVHTSDTVRRMVAPFWDSPRRYRDGIAYFTKLDQLWPNQAWLHANLADLYQALGLKVLSDKHRARQRSFAQP